MEHELKFSCKSGNLLCVNVQLTRTLENHYLKKKMIYKLQKTRIGMTLNALRKKTSDERVAKRAKRLIKVSLTINESLHIFYFK